MGYFGIRESEVYTPEFTVRAQYHTLLYSTVSVRTYSTVQLLVLLYSMILYVLLIPTVDDEIIKVDLPPPFTFRFVQKVFHI